MRGIQQGPTGTHRRVIYHTFMPKSWAFWWRRYHRLIPEGQGKAHQREARGAGKEPEVRKSPAEFRSLQFRTRAKGRAQ